MKMTLKKLDDYLNKIYKIDSYQDYGPNGLQIEGQDHINHIALSVSASLESIEEASRLKANALIVHHGLFWKFHGVRPLTGAFGKRVRLLIENNINLFGIHLPMDGHPQLGHAAQLAKKIGLKNLKPFGDFKGSSIGVKGSFPSSQSSTSLKKNLTEILNHTVLHSCPKKLTKIKSMGIITGGANSEWVLAQEHNLDSYLTGEMKEHDWHDAKEANIHMFSGGHHATEVWGVKALQKKLKKDFPGIRLSYISSDNPA